MPFTPYHLGPAVLIGMMLCPYLNVVALLLASVVLDVEPLFVIMTGSSQPLHGLAHTYLAAATISVPLAAVLWAARRPLDAALSVFGLRQSTTPIATLGSCLLGTFSHVFLDSFLYPEMNPLFPLLGNPFAGLIGGYFVYELCIASAVLGLVIYLVRLGVNAMRPAGRTSRDDETQVFLDFSRFCITRFWSMKSRREV